MRIRISEGDLWGNRVYRDFNGSVGDLFKLAEEWSAASLFVVSAVQRLERMQVLVRATAQSGQIVDAEVRLGSDKLEGWLGGHHDDYAQCMIELHGVPV